VSEASVTVDGVVLGAVQTGFMVLLGVEVGDTPEDSRYIADKLAGLRVFNDEAGKFNRTIHDAQGAVLLISQFTLHGDCRKGRRPSFIKAARPEEAIPRYEEVATILRNHGLEVATGEFGAHMDVSLVNDGPVTVLLDSKKVF